MSKIILGPFAFTDTPAFTLKNPGIISWDPPTNIYGVALPKAANSALEQFPAGIETTQGAYVASPTLISFQTSTTAPTTAGAAATFTDYFRKLILAGGPNGTTELRIYSGQKPASPDIMTNLGAYSANLLISMPINGYSTDASVSGFRCITHTPSSTVPGYDDVRPVFNGMSFMLGICPTFTNSMNTSAAVATWFWYGNVYGGTSDLSEVPFVIGTVGSTVDADLVIPDTVIKPDTAYKSYGFKFEIPAVYTI